MRQSGGFESLPAATHTTNCDSRVTFRLARPTFARVWNNEEKLACLPLGALRQRSRR